MGIASEDVVALSDAAAEHGWSMNFESLDIFMFLTIVWGCIFCSYIITKTRPFGLVESGASMLLGMGIGFLIKIYSSWSDSPIALDKIQFSKAVFFYVLLPPIIFDAGYSLRKRDFFKNGGIITSYALLGTIITAFTIGIFLYLVSLAGAAPFNTDSPLQCLVFGALVSAIDPVAVIAIMGNPVGGHLTSAGNLLYSLIFGESVLNDAVAIVLFDTLRSFDGRGFGWVDCVVAMLDFCLIAVVSVVIGVGVGLLNCYIFKQVDLTPYPHYELSLFVIAAYISYITADMFRMSGIFAIFFFALVNAHYNSYNLSEASRTTCHHLFHVFAFVSETFLFAYLGLAVFGASGMANPDNPDTNHDGVWQSASYSAIFMAVLACQLSRALCVFPLTAISNMYRKEEEKITWKHQFVQWFAGLRGAIAFALAIETDNPLIITTTLALVLLTTLIQGGLTKFILIQMDMFVEDAPDDGQVIDGGHEAGQGLDPAGHGHQGGGHGGAPPPSGGHGHGEGHGHGHGAPEEVQVVSNMHGWWRNVDEKYLKKYFGGQPRSEKTSQQPQPGHSRDENADIGFTQIP